MESILVISHEISEELIAIEEDHYPLLDDVGVQRVLFVMHECLKDLMKTTQSQRTQAILHVDQLLKEEEELPVSLGLELLQSIADLPQ